MAIGSTRSGSLSKKKLFNVALTQETNEELSNLAASQDKSKAEVVRLALKMYSQSIAT
jgi:hypothetical protein